MKTIPAKFESNMLIIFLQMEKGKFYIYLGKGLHYPIYTIVHVSILLPTFKYKLNFRKRVKMK